MPLPLYLLLFWTCPPCVPTQLPSPFDIATRKYSRKRCIIITSIDSKQRLLSSLCHRQPCHASHHTHRQGVVTLKSGHHQCFHSPPCPPWLVEILRCLLARCTLLCCRLTFGYESSPKIFNTLSETVCWILLNNHNISFLVRLLDNFLIISPPSSPQRKQRAPPHPFSSLESLLTQICFRLHSQSKSCDLQFPPCPVLHQLPISPSPRPPQLHPMYYSPRASIHLSFAIYPHLLWWPTDSPTWHPSVDWCHSLFVSSMENGSQQNGA